MAAQRWDPIEWNGERGEILVKLRNRVNRTQRGWTTLRAVPATTNEAGIIIQQDARKWRLSQDERL